MRKNKIAFILLILSMIGQLLLMGYSKREYNVFPFASGIGNTLSYEVDLFSILLIYFPIIYILFFFSGRCCELIHGYGKLLIVRNYSRTKLLLKEFVKISGVLAVIVLIQTTVFYLGQFTWNPLESSAIIKILFLYFLTLLAIVMLGYCLELFISPQLVVIILNIYTLISIMINYDFPDNIFIDVLFFPNLLYGVNNGAIDNAGDYIVNIIIVMIINIFLIGLSILRSKKTDIY